MTSMTGYSYKEVVTENSTVSVEIKSVNSRFLDLNIYLPNYLNSLESYFKNLICQKVIRGKIDVNIRIKETDVDSSVSVNTNAAVSYYKAIKEISKATKISLNHDVLRLIVQQPGVINLEKNYDIDKYKLMIEPVFESALNDFIKDREREGQNMKDDLLQKLQTLTECASFFKEWQPKMEQTFKEQLTNKFHELLGDQVDENRIMTEVASMLVKYTINEEIVRLHSHLNAMKTEIQNNPTPGKKLDFICQEINREINTIGSKNQFAQVSSVVINAKDALENIREQSKNVE